MPCLPPSSSQALGADLIKLVYFNPSGNQRGIWLGDPDGYVVVIAGRRGDH